MKNTLIRDMKKLPENRDAECPMRKDGFCHSAKQPCKMIAPRVCDMLVESYLVGFMDSKQQTDKTVHNLMSELEGRR